MYFSLYTRQHSLPAASTVLVSHMLSEIRFPRLLRGRETSFKMASRQEKAFRVLRFEVSRSVITVQREFRVRFNQDIILV
jgi:hypothetical protein